ncbi:unnamed protein product [Hermetia illucens]|uniref:Attacin C-terminal domain-containing protein n=1 Tax=Hermetia illucens TaxID=343691 RepID=A0A7R8UHA0_HERIL|nr:uncharacterized protein LOC119648354 isoform X1 [Hermetia illucens]CAD7080680.1 unnamed protein product [Hermetia illucens]
MSYKLVALFACLAVASAASIPEQADLREAFETEDAIYIPISIEEANQLRLPRSAPKLEEESALSYISDAAEAEIEEPSSSHGRVRRDVQQVLETEDAYYVPVSDEEAELLRLPRSIDDLALSEDGEDHVEIITDDEVQREKRQLNIQGGGSPHSGFDLNVQGRAKIWESNNGRNTLHGTGEYSQHLGGPYGNSRPNFGGGLLFTHRF